MFYLRVTISYLIYKKLNIVEDRMSVSSLAKLDQRKITDYQAMKWDDGIFGEM